MSAKWRRSKKRLKWFNPNLKSLSQKSSQALRVQKFKTPIAIHPRRYHLPKRFGKENFREPKPLIDIFQEECWLTVVAEIAGFNKETLKIDVKDKKLTLSAKAKDRRYYKSLNLPKIVIPNIIHTTCKNGVLEIKLKKAYKKETIKRQVG
ncbi:Hsp20/alpha crystallin family protein [Candidatus Bathyarchaeota archaeon]|nr:Hsp20/alpha crystallin family protein [Candidatus Bathyarchaeota archaeon]